MIFTGSCVHGLGEKFINLPVQVVASRISPHPKAAIIKVHIVRIC